jgi:hypothetical protein
VQAKTIDTKADPKSAKRYIINVGLGNDNEPTKVFVGANGEDFLIERGKDVAVPKEVLEVLDNAIMGVSEVDPMDNTKTITVDRKRFPYTIKGIVE